MSLSEAEGASPAKAFLLGLLWPPLGYRYAGQGRRGLIAHMVWLALLGAAVAMAMLPPVNLPVLVLMGLPFLALFGWWLASATGAAIQVARAKPGDALLGLGSPLHVITGIVVSAAELCAAGLLIYSLSSIGLVTTSTDDMAPTTLEGDLVVTWKDYYAKHLPERGDVAVVQLPGVEGDRIMRIVGLPGDSLLGMFGALTINGKPLHREALGDFGWRDAGGTHRSAPLYLETLPDGVSYEILHSAEAMFKGTILGASLRIPDGHYFVIGDNRDRTRSSWDFGMLPGLVLGDRPTVIISSSKTSRIGTSVQP